MTADARPQTSPDGLFVARRNHARRLDTPTNLTEARKVLSVAARADGDVQVSLRQPISTHDKPLLVRGPVKGGTLFLHVATGFPVLHVTSGRVVLLADSTWGNSIHVFPRAQVTVVCGDDRKVSVTREDDAPAPEAVGDLSRYRCWPRD